VHITQTGRDYVAGSHAERQKIFGRQLLANVPLVAHIRHSLDQEHSGALCEEPFLHLLRESLDAAHAARVMQPAPFAAECATPLRRLGRPPSCPRPWGIKLWKTGDEHPVVQTHQRFADSADFMSMFGPVGD
jgi:hypothetical protein